MSECESTILEDIWEIVIIVVLAIVAIAVTGGLFGAILGMAIAGVVSAVVAVIMIAIVFGLLAMTLYLLYNWLKNLYARLKLKLLKEAYRRLIDIMKKLTPGAMSLGTAGMIYWSTSWTLAIL
jgi:hypothetical protein